jgi:hypothetical protein
MEDHLSGYLDTELRRIAEEPVFNYLAHNGDAIEARVLQCLSEGRELLGAGFPAASLIRTAAGIEITIRFFLARPLLQGAFLSDGWSELLSRRVLNGRTAEDRGLLPAILRNWEIEITAVQLPSGGQLWEAIVGTVWPRRNDCVHKGDAASSEEAMLATSCLETLFFMVVVPLAVRLGFTRDETGSWSVVNVNNPPDFPDLNPPREYDREDPFK